jgi:hypothetical protein
MESEQVFIISKCLTVPRDQVVGMASQSIAMDEHDR